MFKYFNIYNYYSSETDTKKCQDAEEKGVKIVNENWVQSKISGTGGSDGITIFVLEFVIQTDIYV